MSLDSIRAQAAADLTDVHFSTDAWARSITYNGTDITAVVVEMTRKDNRRATAEIQVMADDVAAPDYRDTVVIDGVTWTVRHWTRGDDLTWDIELERDVRAVFER